jgi:HAD superfamily hydrolase (TIGR01549 family)
MEPVIRAPIRGILWDLDGVLSDTQSIHSRCESLVLAEEGISISPEAIGKDFSGSTDRPLFTEIFRRHGRGITEAELAAIIERKRKLIFRLLGEEGVPWVPGAKTLLVSFADLGLPMAVASSSTLEFVRFITDALGITALFKSITSGHEVPRSKPEPAIFLLAAERIGVSPAECLVVEDAELGLLAAKRAGIRSLALWPREKPLPDATRVVHSFEGLNAQTVMALYGS